MRKAKVKRGTAAGNLHFGPSVHSRGNNVARRQASARFGWKEAMIHQAYNFCLSAKSSAGYSVDCIQLTNLGSRRGSRPREIIRLGLQYCFDLTADGFRCHIGCR